MTHKATAVFRWIGIFLLAARLLTSGTASGETYTGSGFFISESGYFITSHLDCRDFDRLVGACALQLRVLLLEFLQSLEAVPGLPRRTSPSNRNEWRD